MMKDDVSVSYSPLIGSVYIFNLIVGTGALAMPKAFQDAGYILSSVSLGLLCFLSYVTATYVIEVMSISNGLDKICKLKYSMRNSAFTNEELDNGRLQTLQDVIIQPPELEIHKKTYGTTDDFVNTDDLIFQNDINQQSYFAITEKYELGQMAMTYFNRLGLFLFYLTMCIYLYGDLAVYAAAVPNSLRDVACTYSSNHIIVNTSGNSSDHKLLESDPCWPNINISRMNAYRIFLTLFVVLVCPFVFFNLSKTKLLQITTLIMRWVAFLIMIILISIYLGIHGPAPTSFNPATFSATPNLFGICVYSFMCHHSLPSLITPIKNKRRIFVILAQVFLVILAFYLLLCLLSSFCFKSIQSLITLNFEPLINAGEDSDDPQGQTITKIAFFQYFLALFPVFSITASFPIIGITLRNNLRNLITCGTGRTYNSRFIERAFYPLLALIPPIILAYFTHDLTLLVGFTGSYAGALIQYVIPTLLVVIARRHAVIIIDKMLTSTSDQGENISSHVDDNDNITDAHSNRSSSVNSSAQVSSANSYLIQLLHIPHSSPFKHPLWALLILIWAAVAIIFVTIKHIFDFSR